MRLAALLLALVLLLAGCAAPAEDSSTETQSASGTLSETSGTESADVLSGGAAVSRDESEDTLAPLGEDAALLGRTGLPQSELVQISGEEASEISRASANM